MNKYIIHKAVNACDVKVKSRKDLTTFEQQAKYDGCCNVMFFYENGHYMSSWSRTGERSVSMDLCGREMASVGVFRDVAVIGEAWHSTMYFGDISGSYRKGVENHHLNMIINDVIPLQDFKAGRCDLPYSERVVAFRDFESSRSRFAETWEPNSLDPQIRCNFLVACGGYDGLILRDRDGLWERGNGTTGEIIKVKSRISLDLRVLEILTTQGEKTGRNVYRLVLKYCDTTVTVGSGVPHQIDELPTVGDIVEVQALGRTKDGLLREPTFKGVRFDKIKADCE